MHYVGTLLDLARGEPAVSARAPAGSARCYNYPPRARGGVQFKDRAVARHELTLFLHARLAPARLFLDEYELAPYGVHASLSSQRHIYREAEGAALNGVGVNRIWSAESGSPTPMAACAVTEVLLPVASDMQIPIFVPDVIDPKWRDFWSAMGFLAYSSGSPTTACDRASMYRWPRAS